MAAAAAMFVAACATPAPGPATAAVDVVGGDQPFAAEGRLSARRAQDAVSVRFDWRHEPPRDWIAVSSPLGQTIAELSGDASAGRVEVRTADGRELKAADWMTLTEQALGFPLPVSGLAAWVRGGPHRGTAYTVESDPSGRVTLLRQDGWEVVYDYADAAARVPNRLRAGYPDLELRVVIEQWR